MAGVVHQHADAFVERRRDDTRLSDEKNFVLEPIRGQARHGARKESAQHLPERLRRENFLEELGEPRQMFFGHSEPRLAGPLPERPPRLRRRKRQKKNVPFGGDVALGKLNLA